MASITEIFDGIITDIFGTSVLIVFLVQLKGHRTERDGEKKKRMEKSGEKGKEQCGNGAEREG